MNEITQITRQMGYIGSADDSQLPMRLLGEGKRKR